jgi:hypothetical protein
MNRIHYMIYNVIGATIFFLDKAKKSLLECTWHINANDNSSLTFWRFSMRIIFLTFLCFVLFIFSFFHHTLWADTVYDILWAIKMQPWRCSFACQSRRREVPISIDTAVLAGVMPQNIQRPIRHMLIIMYNVSNGAIQLTVGAWWIGEIGGLEQSPVRHQR